MNTFVLKNDDLRFGFELGFFNLFALALLLPIFWLNLLDMACWGYCCCRPSMSTFYQGNMFRLESMGLSLLIFSLLELFSLRLMLDESHTVSLRFYRNWMFWRTLPLTCLLLTLIALPGANVVYGLLALIAGYVFLGPIAVQRGWVPVFVYPGRKPLPPRQHLKTVIIYLVLLVLVPPVFFTAKAWGCSCDKVSTVKANMHTIQTIVETYAVDHQGIYPPNFAALKQEATRPDREYWKEVTNPFTGLSGTGKSYADMPSHPLPVFAPMEPYRDILGIRIYFAERSVNLGHAGRVIYNPITPTLYYIYGLDKNGNVMMDKGVPLTLTNS